MDESFEAFLQRRESASTAFVTGDVEPLHALSTTRSPASIFGPRGDCVTGADEVNAANAQGAQRFRPGSRNAFEVAHASSSGELAYWTGIQRSVVALAGEDDLVPVDLRVTELFRREDGDWKLVHRHADRLLP